MLLASIKIKSLLLCMNDILPRAQACIESDKEAFEHKLKSFKKTLYRYFFYCRYFLLKCPKLGNTNNIITIKLNKQLYYNPLLFHNYLAVKTRHMQGVCEKVVISTRILKPIISTYEIYR